MTIGFFSARDGNAGPNTATVGDLEIFYGLGGEDSLTAVPREDLINGESTPVLAGGRDGDRYVVPVNVTAFIAENGNSSGDELVVPLLNFSGTLNIFFFTVDDGRHLLYGDFFTDTYILILNYTVPGNEFETIRSAATDEVFAYSDFITFLFSSLDASPPDFSFQELQNGVQIIPQGGGRIDTFELDVIRLGLTPFNIDTAIADIFVEASRLGEPIPPTPPPENTDELIVRRSNQFFVDTDLDGISEESFFFGRSTDEFTFAEVGGSTSEDLVLRRGNQFFVDVNLNGIVDDSFFFGRSTDEFTFAEVGGSSREDLIIRRGNRFFVDTNLDGIENDDFFFGRSTDEFTFAEVSGSSREDLIIRRGNRFFVDTNLDGVADDDFFFGRSTDEFAFADVTGDSLEDLIIRRGNRFFVDTNLDGVADDDFFFGRSTDEFAFADVI